MTRALPISVSISDVQLKWLHDKGFSPSKILRQKVNEMIKKNQIDPSLDETDNFELLQKIGRIHKQLQARQDFLIESKLDKEFEIWLKKQEVARYESQNVVNSI